MKKFLSLILALALVMSLGTVAFADGAIGADAGEATGTGSEEVKVKVEAEVKKDNYKVDIVWGTLEFTYNLGTKKWNTGTHTWDEETAASWTSGEPNGNITVTNHSSQKVDVQFAYSGESSEIGGVSGWDSASCTFSQGGSFDGGKFESNTAKLKSADTNPGGKGAEQSGQVTFNIGSLPTPTAAVASTKIGTITATVSAGTYTE